MIRKSPWWRPRTLRRQLVIGVSAIVTAAMIGVGVVSVLSMRDYITTLGDTEVSHSLATFEYSYGKARAAVAHPQSEAATELTDFPGQAAGTVIAVLRDAAVVQSAAFSEEEPVPAPPEVVRDLDGISWENGDPQTVQLGGLGSHRVLSSEIDSGERLVSAVSLVEANQAVARKTVTVAGLVVLALVATAAGVVVVVRYALRPLRRVTATAAQVATLPLAGEDERIGVRVDERGTDPDSEVGIVEHTLNRLLDNVDGALAHRAESDRRMRQFLTDASHELRTPLAAILGYAELTRQDSDMLPQTTEYALDRIEAESRRMTSLVADLLLLSRLDEGLDLETEDLDLGDLIVDVVNDVSVSAPEHHFVTDVPERAVWVRGDPVRLHQLAANLLSNAAIHTPAGVTVTVTLVDAADDGDEVRLIIEDDGPGISGEVLPNLFGRFVRADKARSRELGSTGLGLAIVHSIAEAHGGWVSVDSRPGKTEFTVGLRGAASAGLDRAEKVDRVAR